MTGWQPPRYDPRQHQQRVPRPAQSGYGQVQPYQAQQPAAQQQYWPQQPQPAPGQYPRRAVTQGKLNPIETMFHLVATICTAGLWGFVWWARVHSKKSVTRYR